MAERGPSPWSRLEVLLLAGIMAVAIFFRVHAIDHIPLGLSHDEAYYGQDAIRVLEGFRPIFFPENNGREPLFIYLVALAFRLFGIGHLVLRGVAILAGISTVLISYLLLRRALSPLIAFLGALGLAVCFPHVLASRLALRAILLPFLEAAALYFLWRGLESERRWFWAASGALTGLALYTYPSARFFPLAIVLFFICLAIGKKQFFVRQGPNFLILMGVAILVFSPLGLYFASYPEAFAGRAQQVDNLKFILDGGNFAPLWRDLQNTLSMFSFRGDPSSRYNLAGRPLFDPFMAAAFYLGALLALLTILFRRHRPSGEMLLFIWAFVALIPVALTGESPHFLRAIGAWPPLCAIAASAMSKTWKFLSSQWGKGARIGWTLAIASLMAYSAQTTFRDYFVRWANDPQALRIYGADIGQAARYLRAEPPTGEIFISARYMYDLDRFILDLLLGHQPPRPRWFDGTQCLVLPAEGAKVTYLFPASAPLASSGGSFLAQIANPSRKSDLLTVYRLSRSPSLVPSYPLNARLGDLVALRGFDLPKSGKAGESLFLTLYWESLGTGPGGVDYVFFAHLVDSRGFLWAQADGLGFPPFDWRPGDQVIQDLSFQLPSETPPRDYQVLVGMYDRKTGDRLALLDANGAALGTAVALGSVAISKAASQPPPEELPIRHWRRVHFGDELLLLGFDCGPAFLQAGQPVQVTLFWQAARKPRIDYPMLIIMTLTDEKRTPWEAMERHPLDGDYPTSRWDEGQLVRDVFRFEVPSSTPPGKYGLRLRVLDPLTGEALTVAETGGDSVPIGGVQVLP